MSLKRCKRNLNVNSKEIQYELASRLNRLCNKLHDEFAINCGGCCFTAYCIAKLLEEDNFKFSLIVFDSEYKLKDYTELSELPDTMEHYALILEDNDYNAEGINCIEDDFDKFYQDFEVTSKDILNYYLNNEWNSLYQKSNNKLIQSLIERVYYEFTNSFRER